MPRAWPSWIRGAIVALAAIVAAPTAARGSDGWSVTDPLVVGLAFLSNLAIHESGHHLIAEGVGAGDAKLNSSAMTTGRFFSA